MVRSYILSASDVLRDTRTLRSFPDVCARGGASPGHFYVDALQRMFGIRIEATSRPAKCETVQEPLVPIQTLKASTWFASISTRERVLRAVYWSTARIWVWGGGVKGSDGEASSDSAMSGPVSCVMLPSVALRSYLRCVGAFVSPLRRRALLIPWEYQHADETRCYRGSYISSFFRVPHVSPF